MQSSERAEDDVKTVADAIRENDRFLVVTHENPDGDALGSMLAMTLGLRALRKDVVMYLSGSAPTPAEYRFLDLDDVRRELPDDLAERVLLAVDCANDRRIGDHLHVIVDAFTALHRDRPSPREDPPRDLRSASSCARPARPSHRK